MYNPRFPHKLSLLRPRTGVSGDIIFDRYGNVVYDVVPLTVVTMLDGDPCRNADGSFVTTTANFVNCGYRTETGNVKVWGDVVVADMKIDSQMFLNPLFFGDILEITDYEQTYRVSVVKKVTFNWGTSIWTDNIQN